MTFNKGKSGNPGGTPSEVHKTRNKEKLEYCKLTPKARKALLSLLDSDDEEMRFKAAKEIIDRAIGKPQQAVEIANTEGETFKISTISDKPLTKEEWDQKYGNRDS